MSNDTIPRLPDPVPASKPGLTSTPPPEEAAVPEITNAEDEDMEYLSPKALIALMLSLILVVLLILLDASILSTAIPKITDHFHTIDDIGWYASAYMITNSALQPLTGKVFTYFSLKYAYMSFIALFELGSLICGVASSSTMLVVGRAVAGMGASGLMNGTLTIITVAASPSQRPTLLAISMAFAGAGQILGPLIGGALTQHATWRWCFWINLPIGAVTVAVLLFIKFPSYKAQKTNWTFRDVVHDFDVIGFILFAPACIMLLLALEWGGTTYAWNSATVIGLFCGSGGCIIVFFLWEYRHGEAAMIPLSLVRRHVVYSSMLTTSFVFGGQLLLSYYLPLWFQTVKGASPTMSAVYILPTFGATIVAGIAVGIVTPRVQYLAPFVVFGGSLASIASGLMTTMNPHTGTGKWVGYQILSGVGRGLSMQQPLQAVQAVVAPSAIPVATASVAFAQTLGGAVWLGLGQTALLNFLRSALRQYAPGVDASAVLAEGATSLMNFSAETRHDILLAYNQAIVRTFYLAVGCAVASVITAMGIGRTKAAKKGVKSSKSQDTVDEKEDVEQGRQNGPAI